MARALPKSPAFPPHAREGQGGFVLAATIWTVAILALVAALASAWVGQSLEAAEQRRQMVEIEVRLAGAQASAIYILSTQVMSGRGLEISTPADRKGPAFTDPMAPPPQGQTYVRLDGSLYEAMGVRTALQDARGLVNLSFATDDDLYRLLATLNLPATERSPALARLRDYTDPDDQLRLNGAEKKEYLAANLPPPPNSGMLTPFEVRRIFGWPRLVADIRRFRTWYNSSTTGTSVGLNLNTAPLEVLALVRNMNEEGARKLIVARQTRPLISIADASAIAGVPIPDEPFYFIFFPADSVRIRLQAPGSPRLRDVMVRMTPTATTLPWRVDYMLDLPAGQLPGERPMEAAALAPLPGLPRAAVGDTAAAEQAPPPAPQPGGLDPAGFPSDMPDEIRQQILRGRP